MIATISKYAAYGLGAAALLIGSFVTISALTGTPANEMKAVGGLFPESVTPEETTARNADGETPEEEREAQERQDISVFPLAIPLIAGPGTLASIMIQANTAHGNPVLLLAVFAMTGVVLWLCYLALRLSGQIGRVIGVTGVHVVTRVLGVLLAALAVQFVIDGLRGSGLFG